MAARTPRDRGTPATPASPAPAGALWTEADVAAYLRVSARSVRRMRIPRVKLPGVGPRGITRFDPEEVRAFVEGKKTARPAAARGGLRAL